jgi:hypothetical protein
MYKTPEDNKYLHGYEKEVKYYIKPIEKDLTIPSGKTWKDLDFDWMHKIIVKLDKKIEKV